MIASVITLGKEIKFTSTHLCVSLKKIQTGLALSKGHHLEYWLILPCNFLSEVGKVAIPPSWIGLPGGELELEFIGESSSLLSMTYIIYIYINTEAGIQWGHLKLQVYDQKRKIQ